MENGELRFKPFGNGELRMENQAALGDVIVRVVNLKSQFSILNYSGAA